MLLYVSKRGHWAVYMPHWMVSLAVLYQAITQTNAGLLAIGPIGTNFSEILIEVRENAFENVIRRSKSFCRTLNKNWSWRIFAITSDEFLLSLYIRQVVHQPTH